jgi:hypothetical protein
VGGADRARQTIPGIGCRAAHPIIADKDSYVSQIRP